LEEAQISASFDLRHRKMANSAIKSGGFSHNTTMAEKPVDHGGKHQYKFT